MRILALIPARGNSKRLPGKNIRLLGGKSLIVWSIEIAKNVSEICDILVSTDNQKIANISKKAGALVPWLRPKKLASDLAKSEDVVIHALDWYEKTKGLIDGIILLQPTSPFREKSTIIKSIKLFKKFNKKTVIGVSKADSKKYWTGRSKTVYIKPLLNHQTLKYEKEKNLYVTNGSLYLTSPKNLRKNRSFYRQDCVPLFIKTYKESIDIDTKYDLLVAKEIIKLRNFSG
jgi:N-acylneuraminate cytidylyltransferase